MRLINNINSQRFSYNGVEYFKNFISKVIGNTITVYNAYDSRDVLFENELYSNIQINGTIYGSAALTQSNLLSVIYTRDSLNGIVQTSGYFNRFTNTSSFSLVGQDLIIIAGWAWEIQGFPYSKEDQTTINIPYTTTGKHRIDVVLADTNNNFYLVQGQEVLLANSPAEPAPVPSTLKLTSILVNASGYGTPTDPDNSPIIDNTASHHKNKWNPATNVPFLADGVGNTGDYFICTADGTQDLGSGSIEFKTDDIIHYNSYDGVWFKFVNNNQVSGSFVPYTGATADVDLGTNFLLFGANSFMNGLEFQISDGTTAVRAEPDYMSVQNSNNEVTAQVTGVKLKNKTGSSNSCTITNSNTTGTGNVVTLNTPDKPTGTYTQATLEDFNSFIIQDTAYTLSNTTSLQKIFGVTANGAFNAQANTSYWFECAFDLSGLSTTNSNFSFGLLGTATLTAIRYSANSLKGSLASVNTAASPVTIKTAAASVLCASTNQSVGHTIIKGYIRVNAAGTIIPAVGLGVAVGTAQISAGSYFKITPMVATDTVYHTNDFS